MHPSLSEATANLYAIFCDQDFADSIVIEHGSDYLSAFNNIDNLLPRSYVHHSFPEPPPERQMHVAESAAFWHTPNVGRSHVWGCVIAV